MCLGQSHSSSFRDRVRVWARSGQVRWELPMRQMTEDGQWDTAQGIG